MKTSITFILALFLVGPGVCRGQVSGNLAFSESGSKARAKQRERAKRVVPEPERPPTGTSMFVDADVLMNIQKPSQNPFSLCRVESR